MDIISTIFPFLRPKRRQEQDQPQLQYQSTQNQQQIQVQNQQQLLLQLPIQQQTYYPYPYPNHNSVPYQYNNYLSSTSYCPQPQQKKAKLQVVVPESLFSKSEQRQVVVPESLFNSSPLQQQLSPVINNTNSSNNHGNDDVIFNGGGGGDEWEIESHQGGGVLRTANANDINLEDYIEVVENVALNNKVTYTLEVVTNILSEDEQSYKAFFQPIKNSSKQLQAIRVYSKSLWQTGIARHINKGSLSDVAQQWANAPLGNAKIAATKPLLEGLKSQMINNEIINASIKAVIIQSQSNTIADDRCSVDSSLAENLTVVLSKKNQVSLNIATDVGELSSVQKEINFKSTTNGWRLTINVPSNASDQWKIIQPLLSALKSELLEGEGIDLDRGYGLTTVERTEILQAVRHYILTSKKMSRAVQDIVDNTEGQATPTTNDIYLRPPHHLEGGDLARVQNEATVAFYTRCYSKTAEIEMLFVTFADTIVGKDMIEVVRDAATDIVNRASVHSNLFMCKRSKNGETSWRQLSLERAIEKTFEIMMQSEATKQRRAKAMEELAKRVVMLKEYEGQRQIKGLPLLDTTKPEDVNRLISTADDIVNANPSIKYWYGGLGNMDSDYKLARDEGIQSALRTLFCKPSGRGLSRLEIGPTPDYLCQAEVFILAATVGSARGRMGEIPLIEHLINKERRTVITCFNQGLHGGDTGVDGINLLFLTGYKNLGQRLQSNEMNLCLHGCRPSAVARWNASIPTAEQNYIEWDPRVRRERESTTEDGKIRVSYSLVR